MKKMKKIVFIVVVIISSMTLTGCNKPKPANILPQLESAYNKQDIYAIVECFEPNTQKMMNAMLDMMGGFFV